MKSVNLNITATAENTYDAIVIGSGISGGWAAKELSEKGLKTLVLERGRNVEHIKDYSTAHTHKWEFPHRNQLPTSVTEANPIISKCYAFREATEQYFVKDAEHPYEQVKPFDWIKGYQVGGKSLMWARHTQRWSPMDFESNANDGHGVDWPIRYEDLAPWYSHVEKFAGISGNKDGLPQLPDGEFLKPMEMNYLEKHVKELFKKNYEDRPLIIARTANITEKVGDRGPCQYRSLCERGCPFGGYFSSNSSTLPAAMKTGNMTLRPFSVVHSIIYDDKKGKAVGVKVIDTNTKEIIEYYSKIIFVNAATLNTTLILKNSKSDRFPDGLGNDSGELGHNLMDHNYNARVEGEFEGFEDKYYSGRRPTSTYIARFRNFGKDKQTAFTRGYAYSCGGRRGAGTEVSETVIGKTLKEDLTALGPWKFTMGGMGECLPYHENKVTLSKDKVDDWGMPILQIDAELKENERAMEKDMVQTAMEMLDTAGFKNIENRKQARNMGLNIHEMGTARMGKSPKTSVLNKHNQVWGAENVFVTDGACMTSSACQNPSLTYMAMTARAANYAVEELNKRNL
ncbi:choline dehydrogenase-like flavoprotein [Saonia flava]|uniref:Choline dehydrogenase-like flavoprotein n=1 Tax=Saonia flava TaxID=523696 RepID=A0A846R148_9FLAO|nr:GMC family oxidoreductase [Saonia flava]NJB72153.1 choline dehydrogenase-like flavoprotein [Saonia flava]